MNNFAISREFARKGNADLIAFASTVKNNLSLQPDLAALQPLVDELSQTCNAFSLAASKAEGGGKADRVLRDTRKADLLTALDKAALQVQLMATDQADAFHIHAAGFAPRTVKGSRSFAQFPPAEIISVNRGIQSGTISGKCRKIPGAIKFAMEWSDDNGANWHNGQYSQGTSFLLQDLEPEKRYWVRAKALGTNSRIGDWSEPVTLFVL